MVLTEWHNKRDNKILELYEQGYSLRKVADMVNNDEEFKKFFGDKNKISHNYVRLLVVRNQRGS